MLNLLSEWISDFSEMRLKSLQNDPNTGGPRRPPRRRAWANIEGESWWPASEEDDQTHIHLLPAVLHQLPGNNFGAADYRDAQNREKSFSTTNNHNGISFMNRYLYPFRTQERLLGRKKDSHISKNINVVILCRHIRCTEHLSNGDSSPSN